MTKAAESKLNDFDALVATGARFVQETLVKTVEESASSLISVVNRLAVDGSTALGPALAVALGMCSSVPGSAVFCLTDGEANVGIGSLSSVGAKAFYSQLGEKAREQGVQLNITSFRGTNINSETVGVCVAKSNGTVSIADAENLAEALAKMTSPVVGSCVEVMVRASGGAVFYDATTGLLSKSSSSFCKLGSVMRHSDHFLSFEVTNEAAEQLQFQMVLTWKNKAGQKLMR